MRALLRAVLLLALATPLAARQRVPLEAPAVEPAGTGGIDVVDRALAKLSCHRRLLIVGAHPDDEDTTLLSYVATELGGEAAYLSLSRGEGGQNLIGSELGVGLGLIRTGELLAARQLEGNRQYFTRAFDFGYTRSLEEAWQRWPRGELEVDAVRIVRRFKPQVIVAIFPPDERAGHGQHQASAVIAEAVFALAGEPDRFPQLTAVGLGPWQATTLYRRSWGEQDRAAVAVEFPLDGIDPLSGKSVLQIAAASRSMHRSQDMGTLQRLGREQGGLVWVEGREGIEDRALFGDMDTSLESIADLLRPGPLQQRVRQDLEWVAEQAELARTTLAPVRLVQSVPILAAIVHRLREVESSVATAPFESRQQAVVDLLAEKCEVAATALAAAAGVVVDATTDDETVIPGAELEATVTIWDSGQLGVVVNRVELEQPAGWPTVDAGAVRENPTGDGLDTWRFDVQVPRTAVASMPYYLRHPMQGDLYSWEGIGPLAMGDPLVPGPIVAQVELEIAGAPVKIEREVVFRERDQARGEVRRPLRIVPAVEVAAHPDLLLWPNQHRHSRQIEVQIESNSPFPVSGVVEVGQPGTWPEVEARPFRISEPSGEEVLQVAVGPPPGAATARRQIPVRIALDSGEIFSDAVPVVSYPHIRPQVLPVAASVEVQTFDLELPQVRAIGYVRGASDRVPEVLIELGLPVQLLTANDLESADLATFDVIVIGSRAYETDPALARVNARLLEFVRAGGRMLVQYQQYQFVQGEFTPYRLAIGRPHGRVTDEQAPVRVLRDLNGVFSKPNTIGPADWLGWVQERGLYFASEWDPSFVPLLEVHDLGQPPERGGLLVAQVDRGLYVYTGLSFFRQLPAGVPGAIRLFLNLLALEPE